MKQYLILFLALFIAEQLCSQELGTLVIKPVECKNIIYRECHPHDGAIVFYSASSDLEFDLSQTPDRLINEPYYDVRGSQYVLCVQPTDKFAGGITQYAIDIMAKGYKPEILYVSKINPGQVQCFEVIKIPPKPLKSNRSTRFGIKGGLNSAYLSNDQDAKDARVGMYLGGFLEFAISNKVDIQPEIVYSMQGGMGSDITLKLDYMNIPLIFKFYVNRARTFSIDVGPQLGYMISAKATSGGSTINLSDYFDLNKIDGAICLGVSYKFNPNFLINFRTNVGVTKAINGYDDANTVVQLGVGYRF